MTAATTFVRESALGEVCGAGSVVGLGCRGGVHAF